ncbi:hypothetical protein KKF34_17855 [Myxococcota bacterium]|nr:hypothetical protein [Myxococcota bacterium]MBU1382161.1 hypothetical protein [Myxococcota bacterium]MBU1498749.1 hypothetical protein [Myxococcota bacterium]
MSWKFSLILLFAVFIVACDRGENKTGESVFPATNSASSTPTVNHNISTSQTEKSKPASIPYSPLKPIREVIQEDQPEPRNFGWWKKRHRKISDVVKNCKTNAILFAGDSITEDWEINGAKAIEKHLSQWNIINTGIGGDRTRHLYYRLNSYDFSKCRVQATILMIGTNDTHDLKSPTLIAQGIRNIISLLLKKFPDAPILLYGIFPRGYAENRYRENNNKVNEIISKYHDKKIIFYYNINRNFLNSRNQITRKVMYDYLHLTPGSYAIWAAHISRNLKIILGKKSADYIKITPWSHRFMLLAQPTAASQRIDFISGI